MTAWLSRQTPSRSLRRTVIMIRAVGRATGTAASASSHEPWLAPPMLAQHRISRPLVETCLKLDAGWFTVGFLVRWCEEGADTEMLAPDRVYRTVLLVRATVSCFLLLLADIVMHDEQTDCASGLGFTRRPRMRRVPGHLDDGREFLPGGLIILVERRDVQIGDVFVLDGGEKCVVFGAPVFAGHSGCVLAGRAARDRAT